MPKLRTDLSLADLRDLRSAYESTDWEMDEICDRFSFSPGALRQFAYRRGWKRPDLHYRCGVARKEIPEPRRETAKLLWDSGESCERIARWIGVSENTAFALCNREFGFRNLRLNKQTYYMRRNLEIMALADTGTAIDDIADQFWLGSKTVREIISRGRKSGAKCLYAAMSNELAHMDETYYSTCEAHERVLHSAIACTSQSQSVGSTYILWPTRGTTPMAGARGIAMYLVHVEASYTLTQTGVLFGRDRTTVAHACSIVEDKRDDVLFDEAMDDLTEKFVDKACLIRMEQDCAVDGG